MTDSILEELRADKNFPRMTPEERREEYRRRKEHKERADRQAVIAMERDVELGLKVAPPGMVKTLVPMDVQHGVTVGLLAEIFDMDPRTVRKKLQDCAPISKRKAGHIYDLKAAAQYLVRPVFNVEKYMKTMKATDLPAHMQDQYWSAMRKRQQWEAEAGHLWRTESVLEVLGDVFKTIKFSIQLWPDTVERARGLTPEQREILVGMGDALQNELHDKLMELPGFKQTTSTLSESGVPALDFDDLDDEEQALALI